MSINRLFKGHSGRRQPVRRPAAVSSGLCTGRRCGLRDPGTGPVAGRGRLRRRPSHPCAHRGLGNRLDSRPRLSLGRLGASLRAPRVRPLCLGRRPACRALGIGRGAESVRLGGLEGCAAQRGPGLRRRAVDFTGRVFRDGPFPVAARPGLRACRSRGGDAAPRRGALRRAGTGSRRLVGGIRPEDAGGPARRAARAAIQFKELALFPRLSAAARAEEAGSLNRRERRLCLAFSRGSLGAGLSLAGERGWRLALRWEGSRTALVILCWWHPRLPLSPASAFEFF